MINTENLMEIQLSLSSPTYRGPKGEKPVKGVDYFTEEDIREIAGYIENMNIDLSSYATKAELAEAIENIEETDPTVPNWAKQSNKPSYTANEVGALPSNTELFSGDYNDLINKPEINDYSESIEEIWDALDENYARKDWVEQNFDYSGSFEEIWDALDENYVRKDTDLSNYATKSYVDGAISNIDLTDYASKDYVEDIVAGIETGMLKRSVVQALPIDNIDSNTIYMVSRTNSETNNVYDEYLYVNNSWEKIGSTDVDLTGYATESYVDTAIANIPQSTTYTFTNGLTENNGTVSWAYSDRISGGSTASALRINDITDSAFATGAYSLTVGRRCYAQGAYSFCEGDNNATYGEASHAEGYDTQATGKYTHAEGWGTITSATASHAEGKFNIQDSRFQNVAGNGSSDSNRSTMFARDWQGNEYLAGNLYVGCDNYSTTATNNGGSKVATESYVDSAIANIPSTTSSGATYTAGNGIVIDSNNEISLDNNISLTQQDSETEMEALIHLTPGFAEITAIDGRAMSIDGDTIGFNNALHILPMEITPAEYDEETGDEITPAEMALGIDNDQIITRSVLNDELSNLPTGSSYSAGNGISIDSNNVISSDIASFFQKNASGQIIGVMNPDYPPKNTGTNGINIGININKQGARGSFPVLIGQDNESSSASVWGYVIGVNNTFDGRSGFIIGASNNITENKYSNHSTVVIGHGNVSTSGGVSSIVVGRGLSAQSSFQTVLGTYNIPDANNQFSIIIGNSPNENSALTKNALTITRDNAHTYLATDLYVNCSDFTTTSTGLTTANCGGSKVATEAYVDSKIPTAPSTDGTYTLQCVVSSGTATYSWVSV